MPKFNRLWEECVQEEERIANKEEKLNDKEDQALATHAKKEKNKRKDRGPSTRRPQGSRIDKRTRRDFSSFECFTCHKMGHIARNCPLQEQKVSCP